MRKKRGAKALITAVCAVASLGTAASAQAETNEYAPQAQARDFNGGSGGWSSASEYGGLCIPALTCYTTGGEHETDGGANGAGDGFVQVELFTIANAVTETNAILRSPSFVYRGAGSEETKAVRFSMDRRTDVGALLPAIADNATYTVKAVPTGGPAVTLVDSTPIVGAEDNWTAIDPVNVDPDRLNVGRRYHLEIISTFQPNVEVIGTGTLDYDNVVLRARGGGGGGGGLGNAGTGGGLTAGIKNGVGDAQHKGDRLKVPVGCPRFVAPKRCKLKVKAKLGKRGPTATDTDKLRVRGGTKDKAVLKIRSAFRDDVEERRRIAVRVKVKAEGKSRVVIKRVRVRHNG